MAPKLYTQDELGDKKPQKIIRMLSTMKILSPDDEIEAIIGDTALGTVHNCLITTQKDVISHRAGLLGATRRIPYADITSVNTSTLGGAGKVDIVVGSGEPVKTDWLGAISDVQKMVFLITQKINNTLPKTAASNVSASDEIAKFHVLKEQGIISQEEFNAKKKQLLGI